MKLRTNLNPGSSSASREMAKENASSLNHRQPELHKEQKVSSLATKVMDPLMACYLLLQVDLEPL